MDTGKKLGYLIEYNQRKKYGGCIMKRMLILGISIILIITLVGCKKNDLEDFTSALKLTEEIEKGELATQLKINMDFNTQGLSEEEIKDRNYLKEIEAKVDVTYDSDLEKTIARNYFNFGGLGFDLNFYIDGERAFVKMPIVGKYIMINDFIKDTDIEKNQAQLGEFAAEETMASIKNNLIKILKKDNVFSGKDSVLTTPDGEVKATEYTIKLDNSQIKELINETINTISKDEALKKNIEKYMDFNIDDNDGVEEISLENLLESVSKAVDNSEINNFTYLAFVDIDGYIVKEDIDFDISFKEVGSGRISGLNYSYSIDRWGINKEQEFDYPEINEDNILEIDSFDEGVPFIFEDIINTK